ncbi:FtsX-like permease family protein [Bacteroidota bacterium]
MTGLYFAVRTFMFYLRQNLTVALGVAISTAVLVGGLIIGDSVSHSLERGTSLRLGSTQIAISGNDRIFTSQFAGTLEDHLDFDCTPMLQLAGSANADGGRLRINRVQVNGVDERFDRVAGTQSLYRDLKDNEAVISENLAARLEVKEGDFFVLRVQKASVFPLNTPFVSSENTTVSMRLTVKAIAGSSELGRFNIKITQTAPYNVFIKLNHLNQVMDLEERANLILVSGEDAPEEDGLQEAIRSSWKPEDAGLKIRKLDGINEIELQSERVFIESAIVKLFEEHDAAKYILTYFVNGLRHLDRETPYSFVSTLDGVAKDGVRINEWLARDLNAKKGDTLEMDYFVPGPLRRLEEYSIKLVVEDILAMKGIFADENLVPDLPGLSDAGHCSDWEAGIPIDLEKIREKDEDYWNLYRGTPKAFISLATAEEIWKNRFGDYTAIRFPAQEYTEENIADVIRDKLDPAELGISTQGVRDAGFKAASGGVDFSQLFISLSFLVLISAIILTLLLFRLNLHVRVSQAGTLAAMGYPNKLIRRIYLGEAAITTLAGGIPGLFLAILFTKGVFRMMETLWFDIVRTSILQISIQAPTLVFGYLITVLITWLGIFLLLKRTLQKSPVQIQKSPWKSTSSKPNLLYKIIASLSMAGGLVILAFQIPGIDPSSTGSFMAAGGLILVSLILLLDLFFIHHAGTLGQDLTLRKMILKNAGRNRQRRFAIILLFALGAYTVVLTGSNRKNTGTSAEDNLSGTGGFEYYAESTIPVLYDLNDPGARSEAGIEGEYSFIQFRKNDGDDASCLNLNRVVSPVLLGVDPSGLKERFSFVSGTEDLDSNNPWNTLERVLPGGVVPAIADQTVIQWGLGKKPGDTLFYKNEFGDSLKIKLVGGIAPSVLQGNLIISDENFLHHYPSSSGASIYLIESGRAGDTDPQAETDPAVDLTRALRDNGWFMTGSPARLAEFESVQNTYLSIFAMLGVLAILLGTVGLGIVLVRNIMERRREIGLLQSVGYRAGLIFRMLFTEYFMLISAGILSGFIAGTISTFPQFVSVGYSLAVRNLLIIMLILLANSILWISVFVWFNVRKDHKKTLSIE